MPMTEYLNVGSQQSHNVQLNTPPFPQRSTATAAAGSASQLPAASPKDDSPGAAASTNEQATIMEVDSRAKKNTKPGDGGD